MSQEHDKQSLENASETESLQPELVPFEPGYQPEALPQISVPDLPDDVQSLTAESLSQVPTLTELVDEAPGKELVDGAPTPPSAVPAAEPTTTAQEAAAEAPISDALPSSALAAPIQDLPVQADTWSQELSVRMGKLTDDIQHLNARLDRLEERNKKKA